MLRCVHIFIEKEFNTLWDATCKIVLNQHKDFMPYNFSFNVCGEKSGNLSFETVNMEKRTVSVGDLPVYWSNDIFDKILNVGDTAQEVLYVFLHFPLYRKSAINTLEVLCKAIKTADRPVNVDFVGYCEDMAKYINPKGKEETEPTCLAIPEIKRIYSELDFTPKQNKFVVIQNKSVNGVAILNEEDASGTLCEMIVNLCHLFSAYYDKIFASAEIISRDVVGIGFSSLYFDQYLFSKYLCQKALLKTMDSQSVNNNEVDINTSNNTVDEILREKDTVLSAFWGRWSGLEKDSSQYDEITAGVNEIVERIDRIFKGNRDVTAKIAILALLLSKTESELFSKPLSRHDNMCFENLYSEAIDYFIQEDDARYYKINGEKLVNPIDELKTLNIKLLQSEVTIRDLEKQIFTYEELIEKNDKVKDCFIDDGYYKFGDKKFRLLPTVDDVPLEETYVPHDVIAESVDLRDKFSAIRNQGQQGSCLAFSLASIFEYMMRLNNQEDCDLSESFLYYNARNIDGDGSVSEDCGSKFVPSLDSLRRFGIALEKFWPYNEGVYDVKPNEEAYKDAASRKLVKALNVEKTVKAIKSALTDGYPVACSFTLTDSFNTAGAYIPMPSDEEIDGVDSKDGDDGILHRYHAMVIVGYSDKLQRFLVRNSWGVDWGDNGYCFIPYSYVESDKLFNYACIITEIASLSFGEANLRKIPALEINSSDVKIRYYVAAAELELQIAKVEEQKKKKAELLRYFEMQKTLYSDPNTRDEFINANTKLIQEQTLLLKNDVKESQGRIDEIFKKFKKHRLIHGVKLFVAMFIGAVLLSSWNYVAKTYLNKYILDGKVYTGQELSEMSVQGNIVDEFELVGTNWGLSYWWLFPLCILMLLVVYFCFRKLYNNWREERDMLQVHIDENRRVIKFNENRMRLFRHKTYSAWLVIDSLGRVNTRLEDVYTKMVGLVNNLRAWYKEVSLMSSHEDLCSSFPNILMFNREKLDSFFDNELGEDFTRDIDLFEGVNDFQSSVEFLSMYKEKIKRDINVRLEEKLANLSFNISDHVATGKFSSVMRDVDADILNNWYRQAGVFLHVRSNERSIINTDNNIFAPNLVATRNLLKNKLDRLNLSSLEGSDDNYKMTLVRVVTLSFEECVALRPHA